MAIDQVAMNRFWGWVVAAREEDWDALYAAELPRVYNFFRYRVIDRATAEDLTSTTFEKAWRARRGYRRDRASVSTWLLAIARHVATDHFRRARTEMPLEEGSLSAGDTPEAAATRGSELRRLGTLLAGLPARAPSSHRMRAQPNQEHPCPYSAHGLIVLFPMRRVKNVETVSTSAGTHASPARGAAGDGQARHASPGP